MENDQQRCKNCGGKSHQTKLCPHKGKGTRCFNCNEFSHIGKYCEMNPELLQTNKNITGKNEETEETNDFQKMVGGLHLSKWKLQFFHRKDEIKTAICLGLEESFIRKSCLNKFDCLPQEYEALKLCKLYGKTVRTMGSYELYMTNENEGYYIQCHVVHDIHLHEEMMLGMNFIKKVEIVVRRGKVIVQRMPDISDEEDTDNESDITVRESSSVTHL